MKKMIFFLAVIAMYLAIGCGKDDPVTDPINPPDTTDTTNHHQKDTVRIFIKTDTTALRNYFVTGAGIQFSQYPETYLPLDYRRVLTLGECLITFIGDTATHVKGKKLVLWLGAHAYNKQIGPPAYDLEILPQSVTIDRVPKDTTLTFVIKPY